MPKEERVFEDPEPDIKNMDIGSVVSERLDAMRKLKVSVGKGRVDRGEGQWGADRSHELDGKGEIASEWILVKWEGYSPRNIGNRNNGVDIG